MPPFETTTRPRPRGFFRALAVLILCASAGAAGEPEPRRDQPDLLQSPGAFSKVWNQQFFIGPGVLSLDEVGEESISEYRLPADFEFHDGIILAGERLAEKVPSVFTEVLAKLRGGLRPVLIVSSDEGKSRLLNLLREKGLPADGVRVLEAPTDTIWVRDFGPVFVYGVGGFLGAIDPAYGKARDRDDSVPRAVAAMLGVPLLETKLIWQGGNLLSNGQGLMVTTTQSINANIETGCQADTAMRFLKERLGIRDVVVLEHLDGETTGHVDMFACFTAADTIVVGEYAESADPVNAGILNRNAARLALVRVGNGTLKVIRVPMPKKEGGLWRTCTNVLFANGTLLVPTYPDIDPESGRKALAVFQAALPGWKVFGIDSETLIGEEGGLRCICGYIPRKARPAPARREGSSLGEEKTAGSRAENRP